MILLFTDYGHNGPYLGQVKTVLHKLVPDEKIINLMADAPRNNPRASAYLLAALVKHISEGAIIFAVVDPGVGNDAHKSVALHIEQRWFVGPDNGLFDLVVRQATKIDKSLEIQYSSNVVSASFHGRDIYAPVCASLAKDKAAFGHEFVWTDKHAWPDDLYEIIYIDHFGNAMTGISAARIDKKTEFIINGEVLQYARTFSDVSPGECFWYENSNGLIEIAANLSSAKDSLKLQIGTNIDNK